jgi:hypothetical protein
MHCVIITKLAVEQLLPDGHLQGRLLPASMSYRAGRMAISLHFDTAKHEANIPARIAGAARSAG